MKKIFFLFAAAFAASHPSAIAFGSRVPAPEPVDTASSPERDPNFLRLEDGRWLSNVRVSGSSLYLVKGSGYSFGSSQRAAYKRLKRETQENISHRVKWALMDLDTGRMVAQSANVQKRIFGASSSKVFVGATYLDWNNGELSSSRLQQMADMIVVSSNTAWKNMQTAIGDGSSDRGRERNYAFTQRMGYEKTLGFQGWWDDLHGNELTAKETVEFLRDTYQKRYPGAEALWKVMYTTRTGSTRARKYLPSSLYVGGKTGTYDGPTYDTDIGQSVRVRVRNHLIVFYAEGTQYGLMVLANDGSNESSALLAGGLYREYVLGEDF